MNTVVFRVWCCSPVSDTAGRSVSWSGAWSAHAASTEALDAALHCSVQGTTPFGLHLPTQLGIVSFHCARAFGTDWQRTAVEPCRRYPGLHSNRTIEPAENSEPILLPYLGSGTELHWVSLVRGTAGGKTHSTDIGMCSWKGVRWSQFTLLLEVKTAFHSLRGDGWGNIFTSPFHPHSLMSDMETLAEGELVCLRTE